MKEINDVEIIESIKKGNINDFNLLIDAYKNKAYSMLKRMLKNESDAEEILQDCFLKAYYSLDKFQYKSKFSTYFYRIVYNSAITKLSGKKRLIEQAMDSVDDHYDLIDESYSFENNKELSEKLNEIIEKLPPKYSAVLNLFYLEQLSIKEICEIMATTESNIKVLLYRSRNALKEIIIKNNLQEELI
ncbi:MAG: RNA polymerase sigma factor [Bacteroidota bacterium]|nr:RNA polymerase sigma factor [Bacteroidota bacterium]